jgi:hypothetical protein
VKKTWFICGNAAELIDGRGGICDNNAWITAFIRKDSLQIICHSLHFLFFSVKNRAGKALPEMLFPPIMQSRRAKRNHIIPARAHGGNYEQTRSH